MTFDQTIAQLDACAKVCEHNAPVNDASGNKAQADHERANAANYREAIRKLQG